jgi:hypothetical protein
MHSQIADSTKLNDRIRLLKKWIPTAAQGLISFYRDDKGVFWRDNAWAQDQEQEQAGKRFKSSPTSTARSFFAICEYFRFLHEEDLNPRQNADFSEDFKTCSKILNDVTAKYLSRLINPTTRKSALTSDTNSDNPFTNSHILVAISMLPYFKNVFASGVDLEGIKSAGRDIAAEIRNVFNENLAPSGEIAASHSKSAEGKANLKAAKDTKKEIAKETIEAKNIVKENLSASAGISPSKSRHDVVHDFLTLHCVRGLDAFGEQWLKKDTQAQLENAVRQRVLKLLAYDFAHVSSEFDAGELVFSIELLNRLKGANVEQLTTRALQSIADAQKGGVWPSGGIVSYGTKSNFYIASFEIALTLTQTFIRRLKNNDFADCEMLLGVLDQTFDFVRNSYKHEQGYHGWVNDHSRGDGVLESWTTSIVLQFLIQYLQANLFIREKQILAKYEVKPFLSKEEQDWNNTFPDLAWQHRVPAWIRDIDAPTDPTPKQELTGALQAQFIAKIREDLAHRPRHAASLILHGSPGTGKSSLAKSLAKALGWPFLTVSPPDFLVNGIEGFETAAAHVFSDLSKLRRCVVLFDECEDLFRFRPKSPTVESRTAGAFITAGMLPRLQALRDESWVVFILATNSGLEDLDKAVIRPGRFDFAYEVPYPSLDAAIRFIGKLMPNAGFVADNIDHELKRAKDALEKYFQREQIGGGEGISFALLKSFMNYIKEFSDASNEDLEQELVKLRSGPRSLLEG